MDVWYTCSSILDCSATKRRSSFILPIVRTTKKARVCCVLYTLCVWQSQRAALNGSLSPSGMLSEESSAPQDDTQDGGPGHLSPHTILFFLHTFIRILLFLANEKPPFQLEHGAPTSTAVPAAAVVWSLLPSCGEGATTQRRSEKDPRQLIPAAAWRLPKLRRTRSPLKVWLVVVESSPSRANTRHIILVYCAITRAFIAT